MKVYPIFDRANRASKDKEGVVHVCISDKGVRKYIHTGVKILPKYWDERAWVVGRVDAPALNAIIRQVVDECAIGGGLKTYTNFIDFAYKQVQQHGGETPALAVKLLEKWGGIQEFKMLTEGYVRAFVNYMEERRYKAGTIRAYISALKRIVQEAREKGYIHHDPFKSIKLPKCVQTRSYLTEEEVQCIREVRLEDEKLRWARDCFIFQCYTGLAYIDMAHFDYAKDVIHERGQQYIVGGRHKTKERYRIMLLPPAIEVLARYDYELPIKHWHYSQYNDYCKLIGAYAGIKKNVTTHVARHTFATWALSKGLPIEVVSKMLAHADIKTTQVYAKILQKNVDEGYSKLAEGL